MKRRIKQVIMVNGCVDYIVDKCDEVGIWSHERTFATLSSAKAFIENDGREILSENIIYES